MGHRPGYLLTEQRPNEEVLKSLLAPFALKEVGGEANPYKKPTDLTNVYLESFALQEEAFYRTIAGDMLRIEDVWRPAKEEETRKIRAMRPKHPAAGGLDGVRWKSISHDSFKVFDPPANSFYVVYKTSHLIPFRRYVQEQCPELGLLPVGEELDLAGKHKDGWITLAKNGDVLAVVTRKNPNGRWLSWKIGGYWAERFPLKYGTSKVSSAKVGDIDFQRMYDAAAGRIGAVWDKVHEKLKHLKDERGQVTDLASAQVLIAGDIQLEYVDVRHYLKSREDFIQSEARRTVAPSALIRDGEWLEGDAETWPQTFWEEPMDEDSWLTVIDFQT